ncbi:MAG: hypothetical protein Q7S36_01050 [Candidatus Liptonbacteria bacterium]|nr:hypothetical protein [Candidatus Liptonbacteria bacterium]
MRKSVIFVVALIISCLGLSAEAQREHKPVISNGPISITPVRRLDRMAQLKFNELRVMDIYVKTYGQADFTDLINRIKSEAGGSPNNIIPVLSLGHGYLNRYVETGNREDLVRTLDLFQTAADPEVYGDAPSASAKSSRTSLSWGQTWASSPTAAYLLIAVARLRKISANDFALDSRISTLDSRVRVIGRIEADRSRNGNFPYQPHVSGLPTDGDSKSEENAWEAMILAWMSQMYPDEPNVAAWEAKGRELAFYSIVRRNEGVTFNGEPFSTVDDDYTLTNHWVRGNPYYEVGTVQLLRMGALAYYMNGQEIPAEFEHGVAGLYGNYKAKCALDASGRRTWNQTSDPVGDPTLMPLAGLGDDAFERSLVAQKAVDGWLWLPTEPVTGKLVIDPEKGLTPGSSLGTAIQNGKVFWYYLGGSYLWHFPPTRF